MPPAHPLDAVTRPDPYSNCATLVRDRPHLLRAGVNAAALAARFRYRPLPNARVRPFDFQEDVTP